MSNGITSASHASNCTTATPQDQNTLQSMLASLNSRLRSTADQLRSISASIKCSPINGSDCAAKPTRGDLYGFLSDAHDTVAEIEGITAFLGNTVG